MDNADALNLGTLFADVVGSTRLYEQFGDAIAHAAIEGCLDELKQVTAHFGGRTVKTIGDELMAVFPSADLVCQAAIEMQWRVMERAGVGDERMAIRIGFHYGAAVERDNDVFGDSVNVAARLTEVANGQQIITSAQTLEAMSPQLASGARHLWPVPVRGKSEPIDVFEIMWDGASDATVTLSAQFEPARIPVRLRLVYQRDEVVVGPDRPAVSIGRDSSNELVVDARNASRVHARVEWRLDKFVLVDLSTNGTYVLGPENQETSLRREELILNGDGAISLGISHRSEPPERIEFYCEYLGSTGRMPAAAPFLTGNDRF
ncbi:MAG: adenylate/guanylate cyclase domain-containing protein [Betaproteobacteria bacterium]|nr:MAG: adenylate/guanylate cyclase domain-containing protein [Betaproteobacteria bacterium]